MCTLNLGIVEYLNCFPLLYPLKKQKLLFANVVPGTPNVLNNKFLKGELDITPISSIEYARHAGECLILPDVSIAADGKVLSILLVSKYPINELSGKTVALTSSSATSVVLLKILLNIHYEVNANYITMPPNLDTMLEETDAALLIGDDALRFGLNYQKGYVYDLGEIWKEMTGYPMVYALWVMKQSYARTNESQVQEVAITMQKAKQWATKNKEILLGEARQVYDFTPELLEKYYETIKYDFNEYYQKALLTFFTLAVEVGALAEVPELKIWGTNHVS